MNVSSTAVEAERRNRGTIFLEDAVLVSNTAYPGDQFILRLHAPICAAHAVAGSFAHIQCDPSIPMRRPLSIMRINKDEGWIEILFKIVGEGLNALSGKSPGDVVNVLGPIGKGFDASSKRKRKLLIGGGVGIPPMVFLAETLKDRGDVDPLVIMGSEIPFPFAMTSSALPTPWAGANIDRTMPLLEEWQITTRLTSMQGYKGCFQGYVTDLARCWLQSLDPASRAQVEIFSCGPTPMLRAVAALAREFNLPCQVSLEEFMACAVGGCAGCTVQVSTDVGTAMKRVCVDGPVFDATAVFPAE